MKLTHKTINLEIDVLEKIKRLDPAFNLSEKLRDYLRNYLNFILTDTLPHDIIKLQKQKSSIEKSISEQTAELQTILTQIHTIEEKRQEEEDKRLEYEQEQATKKITCFICGIPKTEEKLKKIHDKIVCNSCYQSGDHTLMKALGFKKRSLKLKKNAKKE